MNTKGQKPRSFKWKLSAKEKTEENYFGTRPRKSKRVMGEEGMPENEGVIWEIIYNSAILSHLVVLCAHGAMSVRVLKRERGNT